MSLRKNLAMNTYSLFLLLSFVFSASSNPLGKECEATYSWTCFKMDLVQYISRLDQEDVLSVGSGVSVVKDLSKISENSSKIAEEMARQFPDGSRVDTLLVEKITDYLSSHSLKLNLFDSEAAKEVMARKGGKKKGGMGMLLAYAGMMKATLLTLALGGIAAIAGKALIAGLMSLMLSSIIGLKSLASGGHTTYEVISKPVHHHEDFSHIRRSYSTLPEEILDNKYNENYA